MKSYLTITSFLLLILLSLGCSGNTPQLVRICTPEGCYDSDRALDAADNMQGQLARQYVIPTYQGEPLSELEERAAQGDPTALYLLGLVYEKGLAEKKVNPSQAFSYYQQSADAGSLDGEYKCGTILIEGRGATRNVAKGISTLRNAAANGHPLANWYLGVLFERGGYLEQNSGEAFRYFSQAAELGVADAYHNLGLMYITGRGTVADSYKGKVYLEKAAERDVTVAQKALGLAYARGLNGVPYDLAEARRWLSIVAGKGDKEAAQELKIIEQGLIDEVEYRRSLEIKRVESEAAYRNMMSGWMITGWYPRYYGAY